MNSGICLGEPGDHMRRSRKPRRATVSGDAFTSPEVEGHDLALEPKGNFVSNDDDETIQAALQGIGLVQHMDFSVRKYLDDGSLVRVLQNWCKPFPGFYLYVPSREQMPSKVRALMDFLVEKRESVLV
jgi:DNA-binding transcriptional LysR family regulator